MIQIIIEAVFFYFVLFIAAYCALSFLYKDLRSRVYVKKIVKKREKMGTMDKILIIEAIAIVAYTVIDLYIFWHVGAEPTVLTASFFAVCGGENGMMAWIRVRKQEERMRKWQLEQEQQNYERDDGL